MKYKEYPAWEGYLNGSKGAEQLFKIRVGDWDMWEKRKHWDKNGNDRCRLCKIEWETVGHIIGECEETEYERQLSKSGRQYGGK